MERHLTTSTGNIKTRNINARNEGGTTGLVVMRADTACDGNAALDGDTAFDGDIAFDRSRRAWPTRNQPHPLAESVSIWMHTLILTGELTHRSVHTLEVEIERLFEEGVTNMVLDLRQLTHIDQIGVAVIAFRCRLCKRQGHVCVLIPGPRFIQRAFEEAGVIDQLPFQEDEVAARRLRATSRS
jgi:anti-anti-sigma factor